MFLWSFCGGVWRFFRSVCESFLALWEKKSLDVEAPSLPQSLLQFAVVQTRLTGSAEVELPNLYPARPHYGPKDFAWTLRALSGVLKASSEPPRPRFGASSGRNRREGLTP